ncbi:Carcinoembryonic antigen-related cell adhesion molecule 1 [Lemmus lemmus]
MELSSAPLHKGQLPSSLLIFWSSPTTAQVTVEAVPPHVAEGRNVLLLVHNMPETPQVFYWYKGENVDEKNEIVKFIKPQETYKTGPAYSGRIKIYLNGSLLLWNVTQKDEGPYMLHMKMGNLDVGNASVQFYVHYSVTAPSIKASKTRVKELDSVHLTCELNASDSTIAFRWLLNGKGIEFTNRVFLIHDRILTISQARKEDSGEYQCEVYNAVSSKRSDPFQLKIRRE